MPDYGDGNRWPLIVFVLVCSINMLALGMDELLDRQGLTTITDLVRRWPLLAVPVLMFQMTATIALAFHFWVSRSLPH